jgi:drug/metabolite transporter (DMT)-like permease
MPRALSPPASSATARGILLMLLGVFLFTAMDALVKGLVGGYPAMQVVWARFTGQFVIVILLLSARGTLTDALRTRFPRLHIARSAFQFGTAGLYFLGLAYVGLAEAQALADISPVLITLGAALFLGEKLGPQRLLGVLAAMTGALIIIRPGLSVFSLAALLPLGSAVCYAAFALITRRVGAHESPWTSMIYGSAFGMIVSTLLILPSWVPIAAADLPLFILVGLLGSAAQLCLIRAFSLAEASVVAPFGYIGILFAILWGIALYDEYPDGWTLLGALVIVLAGLYVWHRETRGAQGAR